MAKKDKRGGARIGTGPKPLPEGEKKIQIVRYYKQSEIESLGGKELVNKMLDECFHLKLKK